MDPAARDWLDGLIRATAGVPTAAVADTPAAVAAERAILRDHLSAWLAAFDAVAAAREAVAREVPGMDPDPAIVITTSPLGIAVAAELLGGGEPWPRHLRPRTACVTERDYRGWCMRHPDPAYARHVNHWSWIKTRVPPQRHGEFARHPLGPGECYWLHRSGTAGAGAADCRQTDLYRFTGHRADAVEPDVAEGLGRPFDR